MGFEVFAVRRLNVLQSKHFLQFFDKGLAYFDQYLISVFLPIDVIEHPKNASFWDWSLLASGWYSLLHTFQVGTPKAINSLCP